MENLELLLRFFGFVVILILVGVYVSFPLGQFVDSHVSGFSIILGDALGIFAGGAVFFGTFSELSSIYEDAKRYKDASQHIEACHSEIRRLGGKIPEKDCPDESI